MEDRQMIQTAPWPVDLEQAVAELRMTGLYTGWVVWLSEKDRGQGCSGLTLGIVPNAPDSYHPESHARTTFLYPVPAAAYNRESWEEWIWAMIGETESHERSEAFVFEEDGKQRRPFKPAHPDGWNPGVVRTVVSDTVTNTPNAGRLVHFPCNACGHHHRGRMGEHFTISQDLGCTNEECDVTPCGMAS